MEEIRSLPLGNETLDFKISRGVVVGDKKWSDTHISSSGGGGYVGPQGGYVSLPSVKSSVKQRHEVWFKMDGADQEFDLDLGGLDVPIREGHKVTFLEAYVNEDRKLFFLINKATRQSHRLLFKNQKRLGEEAAKLVPYGWFFNSLLSLGFAVILGCVAMYAYYHVEMFARSTKEQRMGMAEVAKVARGKSDPVKLALFGIDIAPELQGRDAYQAEKFGIPQDEIRSFGYGLTRKGEDRISSIVKQKFGFPWNNDTFYYTPLEKLRATGGNKADEIFLFLNGYSLTAWEQYHSYLRHAPQALVHGFWVAITTGIIAATYSIRRILRKKREYSRVATAMNKKVETFLTGLEQELLYEN